MMRLFTRLIKIEADSFIRKSLEEFDKNFIAGNERSEIAVTANKYEEFSFLTFHILGPLEINVRQGCVVIFHGNADHSFEIESETLEIRSDFSKTAEIGLTEFDIELSSELKDFVINNKPESFTIQFNKNLVDSYVLFNPQELTGLVS